MVIEVSINSDAGSRAQDHSILTDRKIGAAMIIAGMLIFFSGWVNVYGLTVHRTPTDPPPPDAVYVSHYYEIGVWDFNKIVFGIILISAGATLILRYTFVWRMQTLGQSYPYQMN